MGVVATLMAKVLTAHNRTIARFTAGSDDYFHEQTPAWSEQLIAQADAITEELHALLALSELIPSFDQVSELQENIADERWQTFFFKVVGQPVDGADQLCPVTSKLLTDLPDVLTGMFSILQPGKEIPAHTGPNKAVLRYHLPLVVPTSDVDVCGIRVGDQRRSWHLGEPLLFDDTHEHEAWNLSNEVRVVLFLDVKRKVPLLLTPLVETMAFFGAKFHPAVSEIVDKSAHYNRALVAARG